MSGVCIELAEANDLAGFKRATRALVAAGVPPDAVRWQVAGQAHTAGLFDTPLAPPPAREAPPLALPRAYARLAELLVCHASPERFALLYRLAWRLTHEPLLRHDALDADVLHARRQAREVSRAVHHLHAFVRFRPLAAPGGSGPVQHVAWFEPPHRVLHLGAAFFVRRLANAHWAIATPHASVRWQPGGPLAFGPGGRREDVPADDAGEALWLTYYAHTFNPARLKLATMQRQMPRAYWPNLPEAGQIAALVGRAGAARFVAIDADSA